MGPNGGPENEGNVMESATVAEAFDLGEFKVRGARSSDEYPLRDLLAEGIGVDLFDYKREREVEV